MVLPATFELERERVLRSPKILARPRRLAPLRWEEGLDFPADLLALLPRPPRIALHVAGIPGLVAITFDAGPRADGEITLDADEWRAIARAAAADRVWPADFAAFCRRKHDEPAWRIEEETALAGAQPDPRERWTARRVLDRIGAEVVSIDLD